MYQTDLNLVVANIAQEVVRKTLLALAIIDQIPAEMRIELAKKLCPEPDPKPKNVERYFGAIIDDVIMGIDEAVTRSLETEDDELDDEDEEEGL